MRNISVQDRVMNNTKVILRGVGRRYVTVETVRDHPFAHGQLYVGTSPVRNRRDNLMLTWLSHLHDGKALTKNMVYPELLPSSDQGGQAAPA